MKELQRVRPSSTNQARASQSEPLLLMNLSFIDNSICMNSVNVNGLLVTFGLFGNYLYLCNMMCTIRRFNLRNLQEISSYFHSVCNLATGPKKTT